METPVRREKPKQHQPITRADELRGLLDRLEARLGALGHSSASEAMQIPNMLDEASHIMQEILNRGGNFTPEQNRLNTIYAQFERKAKLFVREIGGIGALTVARADRSPDREQWWWYVDELLADNRRKQLTRLAQISAVVVVVAIIAVVIYQQFFAPSPELLAKTEHQNNAEMAAQTGDYATALTETDLALEYYPEDAFLLAFKGVLQEALEETDAAEDSFAALTAITADREEFLLNRIAAYLRSVQAGNAMRDIDELLALNEESAVGYYYRGLAAAEMGDIGEAQYSYQMASDLASAQGDVQLEALARVQLANAMQMISMPTFEPTTETP